MRSEDLMALYQAHDGKVSDKWATFLEVYESHFSHLRDKPVRILEIGIQNGGSLEIWAKYFPNFNQIVGCDINEKCRNLIYESPRVSVVIGSALTDETLRKIKDICPEFDIIIDDGSHRSDDITGAFKRYYPLLADKGMFVAEDLHCSYWRSYRGGLFRKTSANNFFKKLIDVANYSHWEVKLGLRAYLGLGDHDSPDLTERQLQTVASVFFSDSITVVTKLDRVGDEKLGRHIVTGKTHVVTGDLSQYHGTYCVQPTRRKKRPSLFARWLRM